MNNQSSQRVWKEYLILFAFIAILATVLGFCVPVEQANKRDFVFYWMTGHLLTQGLNPYSEQPIPAAAAPDRHSEKAVILYNAPNALWLIIPLGFMNERNANIFWVFIVVASIVISIRLIRALNPQDNDAGLHIAAYGFAPLLLCITAGQMSCFLLLGMVLFLLMHRQHPLLAGIALALCMLKPHVLVPFGVVVGLWIVRERRYSIFGGFVLGCTASSIVPLIFRPTIWRDYFSMLFGGATEQQFWPTPSMLLRLIISPRSVWPQSLLMVAGVIWAIWYYLRHSKDWNWNSYSAYLLCLVSLFVAPRAWVTDEVLALPALGFAFYSGGLAGFPEWALGAAMLVALIEMFAGVPITSPGYIWTSLAWLSCYLLAMKASKKEATIQCSA